MSSIDEILPTQEINSMLNLPDIINDIDKVPSYGSVPKGWCAMRFGDIATIGQGQVSPLSEPYRNQLHIGPENIESSTGRLIGLKMAEELGLISGKYAFDQDAIVYSKIRPNLNKVCTPDFAGTCSADAYPIWPCPGVVDKAYLTYFMRSSIFVKQAVRTSMRSGMPKINRDDLVNIWLLLPPLDEQLAIADILKQWEKANGIQNDLIAAKLAYKTALAELLLNGKRRFPEFAGQEWREMKLGDLFRERVEMNRPDLKLLAVTGTAGIIDRNLLNKRDTSSEDKSKYLRVAPGDIAYNTMRMWQGVFGLSALEGIISPAYTVCIPKETMDGRFAAQLFKLPAQIDKFRRYSQGLVSDTWNLKFPAFARIEVTIPDLPEQRRISDVLELMDQEVDLLKRQLAAQKQQKEELMQMLLTGQKRVKEFAT